MQVPLLSLNDVKKYYRYSSSYAHVHVTYSHATICPSCRGTLTAEVTFVGGTAMQKATAAGAETKL